MTAYPDLVHQYALAYIQRGIPVFPVRVTPDGVKFPAIKGGHGHLDATTDPETIDGWFGPDGTYRGCGIGGHLAKATPPMAAIDIDVKNGGAGPEQYSSLQAQHGALADTVRVLTPTGGWHDWVQMNGHRIGSTNGGLPNSPDIDIKGVGGWVVLPPTRLADGREYAFEEGHKPSEIAMAVDPGWVASLCPAKLEGEGGGRWRELDRTKLHPLDLRALEALEELGGHDPFIGGDGCVHITRPGKTAGTSASIGYLGPGIVAVWSPNWPGLPGPTAGGPMRVYSFDDLTSIDAGLKALDDAPSLFVDWDEFWRHEPIGDEWLIDNVFALGRAHVIYASHKQGKSLFTLCAVARLVVTRDDVDVIYLDYEMTLEDLRERLEDMGYGPEVDLSRLHYALLPSMPPLDTPEGAAALLGLTERVSHEDRRMLVVIDTMGRAVHGEENSNDTVRDFYRHTGSALKRAGITWARLDHAGKDPGRGQRGGSAKGDDVDVVWKLVAGDDGVTLHRDASRLSWVPEKVAFRRTDSPLDFVAAPRVLTAGTTEIVELLEHHGVPVDAPSNAAFATLKKAGCGKRRGDVLEAQKWRRENALIDLNSGGTGTTPVPPVPVVPGSGTAPAPLYKGLGGYSPETEADQESWSDGACAFVGGSLWCVRDPCPNPHHRVRPA